MWSWCQWVMMIWLIRAFSFSRVSLSRLTYSGLLASPVSIRTRLHRVDMTTMDTVSIYTDVIITYM